MVEFASLTILARCCQLAVSTGIAIAIKICFMTVKKIAWKVFQFKVIILQVKSSLEIYKVDWRYRDSKKRIVNFVLYSRSPKCLLLQ